MFEDLKEICEELSNRIKTKEIKLIENAEDLVFIVSLPTTKIKEITFELKEEQKDNNDKINTLNELIIKLKDEIREIKDENKKEINELKNNFIKKINELKNEINDKNNEINELKEQIKSWLKYKESKELLKLKNSLIINNNIEYSNLIKNWINPDKNIKGKLLYRLSKDGEQISTFHSLCDNKGATLTLFETNEGNKGGIYTPLSWDSNSDWKKDMETFIFNLNKNQKYKKLQEDYSIRCNNTFGPWISYFGFQPNQMKKIEHRGLSINSYYEKGAAILPNNTSDTKFFEVKEVEVYKIMK